MNNLNLDERHWKSKLGIRTWLQLRRTEDNSQSSTIVNPTLPAEINLINDISGLNLTIQVI